MTDGNVTQEDRPEWLAERITPHIELYAEVCGLSLPDDLDSAIADMICDLLVLARRRGIVPKGVIEIAVANFLTVEAEQ